VLWEPFISKGTTGLELSRRKSPTGFSFVVVTSLILFTNEHSSLPLWVTVKHLEFENCCFYYELIFLAVRSALLLSSNASFKLSSSEVSFFSLLSLRISSFFDWFASLGVCSFFDPFPSSSSYSSLSSLICLWSGWFAQFLFLLDFFDCSVRWVFCEC